MTCGWTGRGKSKGVLGQTWQRSASAAGVNEIFIAPTIDRPFQAIDTLAHELIHAIDDCASGHRGRFRTIALAIGMQGRMKSASAGPELAACIDGIVADLGPYPHARLDFTTRRQSTRLLKCWCDRCGYTARVAASWIDKSGTPICPTDGERMTTEHRPSEAPSRPKVKRLPDVPTITDDELERAIRAARRRMQRTHPDKGGDHEAFIAARAQYEALVAERDKRKAAV